jgi:hypothetical protein
MDEPQRAFVAAALGVVLGSILAVLASGIRAERSRTLRA